MTSISARTLRFYQGSYLVLQLNADRSLGVVRHQHLPLALREDGQSMVLACDAQDSIHRQVQDHTFNYTPYGHCAATGKPSLAFTGELLEPILEHYLLGNGYRAYSTSLRRFQSPDSLSPFGEGGLNAYGYCGGDPVNQSDPSGHGPGLPLPGQRRVHKIYGSITPTNPATNTPPQPTPSSGRPPAPASHSLPTFSTHAVQQGAGKSLTQNLVEQSNLMDSALSKLNLDIKEAMKEGHIDRALALDKAYNLAKEAKAQHDAYITQLYSPSTALHAVKTVAPSTSPQTLRTQIRRPEDRQYARNHTDG